MTNIPLGKKSEDEWALHYKGFCPETGERRSEHALNRKNTGKITKIQAKSQKYGRHPDDFPQMPIYTDNLVTLEWCSGVKHLYCSLY